MIAWGELGEELGEELGAEVPFSCVATKPCIGRAAVCGEKKKEATRVRPWLGPAWGPFGAH